MVREFKEVTEREFFNFINNYPNRLIMDNEDEVVISYADCSIGLWPESIVAKFYNNVVPEASKFEVLSNFKEVKEEILKRIKEVKI